MILNYARELSREGIYLSRDVVAGLDFSFVEGKCAADSGTASLQMRERQVYIDTVLKQMVMRGEISDGSNSPFDDRKLRYDSAHFSGGRLEVGFGATHYLAFRADLRRTLEEMETLKKRGRKDFDDDWAYFSRAPGVAALVISREGKVILGERQGGDEEGVLDSVAGHLTYKNRVQDVDIYADMLRELEEERGLGAGCIVGKPVFVGVYSEPQRGDLDFTYIVRVDVPIDYFTSGRWMERVREREHKNLVVLDSFQSVEIAVLEGGVVVDGKKLSLMYSTYGALASLRKEDLF